MSRVGAAGWSIRSATPPAMGSIMSAVAVFESHMESSDVATRNPQTSRRGEPPTRARTASATRR
jgi:hypothetical protein